MDNPTPEENLKALAAVIRVSPQAAALVCDELDREEERLEELVPIRIPREMIERAEALWDKLLDSQELKANPPRRSAAGAVRLVLLHGLKTLEEKKKK